MLSNYIKFLEEKEEIEREGKMETILLGTSQVCESDDGFNFSTNTGARQWRRDTNSFIGWLISFLRIIGTDP